MLSKLQETGNRSKRKHRFPEEELELVQANNPGKKYQPSGTFETIPVEDGTIVDVGRIKLRCIFAPGHTPADICLYQRRMHRIPFSGDHVLFDITPNISIWGKSRTDALATYFVSLEKVAKLPASAVPAGTPVQTMKILQGRIETLLHHHEARCGKLYRLFSEAPGISGYEVAKRMSWSIRAKGWDDFPMGQKWFAVGEAITHLDCLVHLGAIRKETESGHAAYFPGEAVDLAAAIQDYYTGCVLPQ